MVGLCESRLQEKHCAADVARL
jgi:hypothetical protein